MNLHVIDKLPLEILTRIFNYSEVENIRAMVPPHIGQVSKFWRELALQISDLWCTININLLPASSDTSLKGRLSLAALFIKRSRGRGLSLHVVTDCHSFEQVSAPLMQLIADWAERWKDIYFTGFSIFYHLNSHSINHRLVSLRSCTLKTVTQRDGRLTRSKLSSQIFSRAPQLLDVTIGANIADDVFDFPYEQLTSLSITLDPSPLFRQDQKVLQVFSLCPNLRICSLVLATSYFWPNSHLSESSVRTHNLTTLRLTSSIETLHFVPSLPCLRRLGLCISSNASYRGDGTELVEFAARCGAMVEYFTFKTQHRTLNTGLLNDVLQAFSKVQAFRYDDCYLVQPLLSILTIKSSDSYILPELHTLRVDAHSNFLPNDLLTMLFSRGWPISEPQVQNPSRGTATTQQHTLKAVLLLKKFDLSAMEVFGSMGHFQEEFKAKGFHLSIEKAAQQFANFRSELPIGGTHFRP